MSAIDRLRDAMNRKLYDKFEQFQHGIAGVKGELLSLKVQNDSLCAEQDIKLKAEKNNLRVDDSLVNTTPHELQRYSRINNFLMSGIPVIQGKIFSKY